MQNTRTLVGARIEFISEVSSFKPSVNTFVCWRSGTWNKGSCADGIGRRTSADGAVYTGQVLICMFPAQSYIRKSVKQLQKTIRIRQRRMRYNVLFPWEKFCLREIWYQSRVAGDLHVLKLFCGHSYQRYPSINWRRERLGNIAEDSR